MRYSSERNGQLIQLLVFLVLTCCLFSYICLPLMKMKNAGFWNSASWNHVEETFACQCLQDMSEGNSSAIV